MNETKEHSMWIKSYDCFIQFVNIHDPHDRDSPRYPTKALFKIYQYLQIRIVSPTFAFNYFRREMFLLFFLPSYMYNVYRFF